MRARNLKIKDGEDVDDLRRLDSYPTPFSKPKANETNLDILQKWAVILYKLDHAEFPQFLGQNIRDYVGSTFSDPATTCVADKDLNNLY